MAFISRVIKVNAGQAPSQLYVPSPGEIILLRAMSACGPGRPDVVGKIVWAAGTPQEKIIESWCGDKSVSYGDEYKNEFEFVGDGVLPLKVEFVNDSTIPVYMGLTVIFDKKLP